MDIIDLLLHPFRRTTTLSVSAKRQARLKALEARQAREARQWARAEDRCSWGEFRSAFGISKKEARKLRRQHKLEV